MESERKSVLFVCLGNTCRSPIAEAVLLNLLKAKGLENKWSVDSAAIKNWHVGSPPNQRSQKILKSHGLTYSHIARQITQDDFLKYDFILGMDLYNLRELNLMAPDECKAKIRLLGAYDKDEKDSVIWDPYFDDKEEGFVKCYEQCVKYCEAFLETES